MTTAGIKDNEIMYKTNYPRGCLFKQLQLRTNLKAAPAIYRVELIDRSNEKILMGGRQFMADALALYTDLGTLSASEVEAAFSSMA
ncbi:TPA: hypothetical protein ACW7QV_003340 [Citrobacter braakii]|uniref:Uncharacterized protein n=1 Tax=Citrobacter braakii TaxID=57706 RepID=A0AAD1L1Z4_CITBR|nr:hypothetical protein KAM621c_24300 [Citrobacter braakii]HEE0062732.1 hypothetical protein [Citrobacter braakii]HEE9823241.1 hypothetical protein [Citrobacter braakii]